MIQFDHHIILPGVYPDLNTELDLVKRNRHKYGQTKKKFTAMAKLDTLEQNKGNLKLTGPLLIKFVWYVKDQRKDPDNIGFGRKYILDGMVDAKFLKDDSFKIISSFIETFKIDKKRPRVEVFVKILEEI